MTGGLARCCPRAARRDERRNLGTATLLTPTRFPRVPGASAKGICDDATRRGCGTRTAARLSGRSSLVARADAWREGSRQRRSGANLRNVWTIPTHSFPDAHFATFPPALVEPCIRAGTSERGVCAQCGAPWVREVERLRVVREKIRASDAIRRGEGRIRKRRPGIGTQGAPPLGDECANRSRRADDTGAGTGP